MISIIGMGMGNQRLRTCEAQQALEEADLIIGASRLLASLEESLHLEKFTVKPLPDKRVAEAKKSCRIMH